MTRSSPPEPPILYAPPSLSRELTFGAAGDGPGQFQGALGVALDASGRIYVADADNNRIQVFQGF